MSRFAIVALVIALLTACSGGSAQSGEVTTSVATSPQSPTVAGANQTLPPATLPLQATGEPQRIEFESSDGTRLVGTFWPPAQAPAPGVLLMHWNPGDRSDWMMLAGLLQGVGMAGPSGGSEPRSYAVFAFDFRGHGESGGSSDTDGYLQDANAALALFRSMQGVDPEHIVLIGASIGADAAVAACGDGCIGAISLSPGGYLGTPYAEALNAMGDQPVLCVAAEGDEPARSACEEGESSGVTDYQVQMYEGNAHAMEMFDLADQQPMLLDLIFEWLGMHIS